MCITHVCYTVSSAGTYIKMNGDMVTCYFHSGGMEACNCTLLITTKKKWERKMLNMIRELVNFQVPVGILRLMCII